MFRCFLLTISSWSSSCPDEDRAKVCPPHIHGGIFLHSSLLLPKPPLCHFSICSLLLFFEGVFNQSSTRISFHFPSLVLVCMLICARNGEHTNTAKTWRMTGHVGANLKKKESLQVRAPGAIGDFCLSTEPPSTAQHPVHSATSGPQLNIRVFGVSGCRIR